MNIVHKGNVSTTKRLQNSTIGREKASDILAADNFFILKIESSENNVTQQVTKRMIKKSKTNVAYMTKNCIYLIFQR